MKPLSPEPLDMDGIKESVWGQSLPLKVKIE